MQYQCVSRLLLDDGWHEPGTFVTLDKKTADRMMESGSVKHLSEAKPTEFKPGMVKTPWIHDPSKLKSYDLATLNAMILEADKTLQPYDKKEDAIHQLSLDFAEWQRLSS